MTLMINEECVNCGLCVPECPNDAIPDGQKFYEINPYLCTECVGAFERAQCARVCPTNACVPDPGMVESREALQAKYDKIHGG